MRLGFERARSRAKGSEAKVHRNADRGEASLGDGDFVLELDWRFVIEVEVQEKAKAKHG